jgi:hypothetical protein
MIRGQNANARKKSEENLYLGNFLREQTSCCHEYEELKAQRRMNFLA